MTPSTPLLPRPPVLRRRAVLGWATSAACVAGFAPAALRAQTTKPANSANPPRLVTVGGAITEMVYALGAESQLVGTDTTSLYPAAAQQTPKVGYMRTLSAEGLLALKPSAVIGTTEAGPPVVMDQLRSAGVRVELVESDHSWAEVQRKLQAVGRGAGREAQARALQTQLDADWAAVQQQVAQFKGRKPRVLFILSHSANVQVAGEKTAADALLRFIGAQNVMAGYTGYRPMTSEAMAAAAPDLILTTTQGIEAQGGLNKFWLRPELALTPAFKTKALVQVEALELLGFGPRLPATVRALHKQIVLG